ncbi:putative immunity protein [Microbacterium sp.]|uniref:putative immunity protein n=1 Tax=Microbacterium sp. TaxID=51671 RepID=UPI003A8BD39A
MASPQALSESDRRTVAAWAAECAEHVFPLFDAAEPHDPRVRDAIDRARAYSRGELRTADEIRHRGLASGAARSAHTAVARAAARAAGQASAVAHMGAHALGAAAYAAKAIALAAPDRPEAAHDEVQWQLAQTDGDVRVALRLLPPVGQDRSGPLSPGLLSTGLLGDVVREIQAALVAR